MATWRKDFLPLTVHKVHINKVYFVVVVFIFFIFLLFYFICLSFDGGQDLDILTTQIEEWATVSVLFIYLQ